VDGPRLRAVWLCDQTFLSVQSRLLGHIPTRTATIIADPSPGQLTARHCSLQLLLELPAYVISLEHTQTMSSAILYKFRSGTTFEAVQLPGSAARLFDVKKAIVTAKKLDQGAMEFDLSVRDATTNQEYTDESMLLPRGTRVVVQRLPAAKGHGFLARLARSQYGGGGGPAPVPSGVPGAPDNFYTIDGRAQDDDEEFVSSSSAMESAEEKELAALRAATDAANSQSRGGMSLVRSGNAAFPPRAGGPAGAGRPPPGPGAGMHSAQRSQFRQRPNADPELRDQEKELAPKKRATGIPRTFLNLKAPPKTDGGDAPSTGIGLQPNAIGFEELVNRKGGQSESMSGTKRDFDYALKLTATTIPEYLQCAICQGVVKDAMILPWDPEGRTTCESCIRDALTQNGFRCPLTNQDGVSPDDLLPNHALRKAAEQFVKGVMAKMEEIDKQQVEEDETTEVVDSSSGKNILEGDAAEKGVLVSKKTTIDDRKKQKDDDPFGGDDDFGGDVFAVEEKPVEEKEESPEKETPAQAKDDTPASAKDDQAGSDTKPDTTSPKQDTKSGGGSGRDEPTPAPAATQDRESGNGSSVSPATDGRSPPEPQSRRDKRRGPPIGYAMGPAGASATGPRDRDNDDRNYGRSHYSPRMDGDRGDRFEERHDRPYRGGGGRQGGRFGGRGDGPRRDDFRGGSDDADQRPPKRIRSDSESHDDRSDQGPRDYDRERYARDDYGGRGGRRGGPPPGRFRRGGGRGWDDDRRGFRGGGGGGRGRGYRGGRGRR